MKCICKLLLCTLLMRSTYAQLAPSLELKTAKALLQASKYEEAEQHLRKIYNTGEEQLRPMAGLYLGVCFYKQASYTQASKQFAEVAKMYPKFGLQESLLYWQGLSAASNGQILVAFSFLEPLSSSGYATQAAVLKARLLDNLPEGREKLSHLAGLYEAYPKSTAIETRLQTALRLYIVPSEEAAVLDTLFKSNWSRTSARILLSHTQSQTYYVAVLLPFFLRNWQEEAPRHRKQSFVWSLYEGLLSAQHALAELGISLRLYPYDTRRSSQSTLRALSTLRDKNVDLIIGPLYWEAIAEVQTFAKERGIPMLNPLSANPRLSRQGPHSWLFQADDLTRAHALAAYVSQRFDSRRAAIFCEQLPRSISTCETYAKALRRAGFEIALERYLSIEDATAIQESLTVMTSTLLKDFPSDSVPEEEEGYVFRKGTGRYGEQEESWYKEKWKISANEIGHIFVAGRHPSFLSYAISAVEQRPDTIPIFTEAHWLSNWTFDYAQIERLGVHFIGSNYLPQEKIQKHYFREEFLARWGEPPDRHACLGYELLFLMGQAMHRYGSNLMYKLQRSGNLQKGPLGIQLRYSEKHQDNQVVNLLRLLNGRTVVLYLHEK